MENFDLCVDNKSVRVSGYQSIEPQYGFVFLLTLKN